MERNLTLNETARYLGISSPTVLNWTKQGFLVASKVNDRLFFNKSEVDILLEQIETGTINRLSMRANKKNSVKTFLPDEYLTDPSEAGRLSTLVNYIADHELKTEESLFVLCLNYLVQNNMLQRSSLFDLLKVYNKISLHEHIRQELNLWQTKLDFSSGIKVYEPLLDFTLPMVDDAIGLIFQSIKKEGSKSKEGSYYTPSYICEEMLEEYMRKIRVDAKILDPCCGTGQFLLSAGKLMKKKGRLLHPEYIWGYDLDPLAVQIARINLMVLFRDFTFSPNIYQRNFIYNFSLDDKIRKYRKFDLIVGNPPWGSEFRFEQLNFLKENYPQILTMESYSYFIFIGMNLLSPGGFLSYILPESILNVKTHKDIRQYILQNSKIILIKNYGRLFKNVFSPVIRIDLEKKESISDKVLIMENGTSYTADSHRFFRNKNFVFDIYNTETDFLLIKKIESFPHTTLHQKADWALGIVTGDNHKFLSDGMKKGYHQILKGTDIERFYLKRPTFYLHYDRDTLQQCAPLSKYQVKEKLIYRFISNRLVFAYDEHQLLTLNSANIVVPKIDSYPLKAIMALFNSSLYHFLFRKKFFTHKVLREHLEQLPLPLLPSDKLEMLVKLADMLNLAHLSEELFKERYKELDQMVFDLFLLTPDEKDLVYHTK